MLDRNDKIISYMRINIANDLYGAGYILKKNAEIIEIMPKVSIVLPTYNGEKYIEESINSILKQTYQDWELIIVNDGSNDNTSNIVKSYAILDKRIKIINNIINLKLPASLNIGFKEAIGEYFTWTSDDNMYLPTALEKMVAYLDANKDDVMVCAWMDVISENSHVYPEWMKYDEEFMMFNDCVGACFMYKKNVLKEIGEYDTSFFLVEDYEYWLRILTHYGHIGWINEKLYLYRAHAGNLTETRRKDIKKQLLRLRRKYLNEIMEYYRCNYAYLTRIYIDFLLDDENEFADLADLFFEIDPNLKKLKKLQCEKNIIAYGAGKYGDKAAELLGDRLDLYIDKRAKTLGFQKNGKKIIEIDQIEDYADRNVLISMSGEKISDALSELALHGVNEIYVCMLDD